jgi:hypothetical protein
MNGVVKTDLKGLWAICWRSMLFIPIMLPIGILLLVVGIGAMILPPAYALICFAGGDVLLGIAVLVGWIIWIFVSRKFYPLLFQGWDHGGI